MVQVMADYFQGHGFKGQGHRAMATEISFDDRGIIYMLCISLMCACLFAGSVHSLNAAAMSVLNKELFVLPQPTSRQLDVYESMYYISRGTINIPVNFYGNLVDMAACCYYNCVYLANASGLDFCIVRLQLPSKLSKWSVSDIDSETTLSVTSSHHLLVVCGSLGSKKLKLFSTDGVLHKTVERQPDLASLQSVTELMPGRYVTTRGRASSDLHQVCVINSEGEVLQTYGGLQGSYDTLMDTPRDAVVDKDGFVYVVEEKCDRLIVFTPQFDYIHCINSICPVKSGCSKSSPRLKIDNERRRLFVRHVVACRTPYTRTYTVSVLEIAV